VSHEGGLHRVGGRRPRATLRAHARMDDVCARGCTCMASEMHPGAGYAACPSSLCPHVCACMCMYLFICMCMRVCVCACAGVCGCVCVCICVCMYEHAKQWRGCGHAAYGTALPAATSDVQPLRITTAWAASVGTFGTGQHAPLLLYAPSLRHEYTTSKPLRRCS